MSMALFVLIFKVPLDCLLFFCQRLKWLQYSHLPKHLKGRKQICQSLKHSSFYANGCSYYNLGWWFWEEKKIKLSPPSKDGMKLQFCGAFCISYSKWTQMDSLYNALCVYCTYAKRIIWIWLVPILDCIFTLWNL